jgi:hypothetical protein
MRWMDQLLADPTALADLAAELRIVAVPGRSPDASVARLWYRAREPYFELFVDVRADGICWWQLTLRGYAWTWTRASSQVRFESTSETDVHARHLPATAVLRGQPGSQRAHAVRFAAALLSSRSEPFIRKCGLLAAASLGEDEAHAPA